MTHRTKQLVVATLALAMFSLVGFSGLQINAEASVLPAPPMIDFCQDIFIQCGGSLVCPNGCDCMPLSSGSGVCVE